MEKRTIWVKPSTFAPEFEMIIPVPTDRDDEEYIDELLDGILNDEFRYNLQVSIGDYSRTGNQYPDVVLR